MSVKGGYSFVDGTGQRRLPQPPCKITERDQFGQPVATELLEPDGTVLEWDAAAGKYGKPLRAWLEGTSTEDVVVEDISSGVLAIRKEPRTNYAVRVERHLDGIPGYFSVHAVPDDPMQRFRRKRIYLANKAGGKARGKR